MTLVSSLIEDYELVRSGTYLTEFEVLQSMRDRISLKSI